MPLYRFDIFHGEKASSRTQAFDFADDRAAWKEATGFCSDLSRDIFSDLNANSEWRLEVTGEDGKALFRFRVLTESP